MVILTTTCDRKEVVVVVDGWWSGIWVLFVLTRSVSCSVACPCDRRFSCADPGRADFSELSSDAIPGTLRRGAWAAK